MLGLLCLLVLCGAGRYDRGVSVFSPEGEILQVVYAERAAARGLSLVCLATRRTVLVLTPSLPTDALLDRKTAHKLNRIDEDAFMGFSGLSGDGRALLRLAQRFSVDFRSKFGVAAPVASVAQFLGDLQHAASLKGSDRPYGVHVVLFGFEASEPSVLLVAASGQVSRWRTVAVGGGADEMNMFLGELMTRLDKCYVDILREALGKLSKLSGRSGEWLGVDLSWFSADKETGAVVEGNVYRLNGSDLLPEDLVSILDAELEKKAES